MAALWLSMKLQFCVGLTLSISNSLLIPVEHGYHNKRHGSYYYQNIELCKIT